MKITHFFETIEIKSQFTCYEQVKESQNVGVKCLRSHEPAHSFSNLKTGPKKAKDSLRVSHLGRLADPDLLIQNLVVFHQTSRTQSWSGLELLKEIQECICTFRFVQSVCIERTSYYHVYLQSLTQTCVLFHGIVKDYYTRT